MDAAGCWIYSASRPGVRAAVLLRRRERDLLVNTLGIRSYFAIGFGREIAGKPNPAVFLGRQMLNSA
jgi:hypothetical protein